METNLQTDPMLRRGRAPWGWPLLIALAVLAVAAVLFATNQEDSEVAETTPAVSTTGEAPQGSAPTAPPAKQDATGSSAERGAPGADK
jgi:hypothetical protein